MSNKQKEVKETIPEEEVLEDDSLDIDSVSDNGSNQEVDDISDLDKLKNLVVELENENTSLKDQILRKQAESDNYRKRILREKEDSIKYGNSNLLMDLIPIIDDFERAIKSTQDSADSESFHSGIELIEKQFVSMLDRNWSLKRMVTVGKEFDPQLHEAIGMEKRSDYDVQTVIEDYQSGYILHDRVLRPAKVKVAMPIAADAEVDSES